MTAVMISSASHYIKREATQTISICHKLMQDAQYNNYNERIQNSLILFTQQIVQNIPEVNAAGFFNINYTLLLSIFGTVATQLIMLLQVNSSK